MQINIDKLFFSTKIGMLKIELSFKYKILPLFHKNKNFTKKFLIKVKEKIKGLYLQKYLQERKYHNLWRL